MNEFLTEQLVKQNKTAATTLKKTGLIVVTVLSLFLGFIHPMLSWVTIILVVLDMFLFRRMNVEFEYVIFNFDLDIDKIFNKESRKRVFSTNIKKMEVIAPAGAAQLQQYQGLKKFDFSSHNPNDKVYEMVTQFNGENVVVVFNPNETILNNMKSVAPSKVFF